MNEEEIELLDCFLNKGWGCDLDEIYSIITKLLDSYNQEKEKNKKLEKVIDIMTEDIINGFVLNFGSIERAEEYYFNKAKEKANDK